MKLINDDILSDINPDAMTIIIHGCNCYNVMGAGIAKYLKDKFKLIYEADCKTIKGDASKLGTINAVNVDNSLWIVNCYTQLSYGSNRDVDYEAIYKALSTVNNVVNKYKLNGYDNIEVRSPQIGCGLAGGEWSIVEKMFDHLLPYAKIYYI